MAAKTKVEILFFGDSRTAQRAVRDLAKANSQLETRMQATGQKMQDVGSTMSRTLTPAITAGLGASVVSFGSFDAAMTQSLAIMGDVDTAMRERMSGAAKQVARDLNISSEEAARSFFYLASAGLDAEQSLAALPQVATFAKAGMFGMATATDLATDAQSALGLKSDDTAENLAGLTRTTDVLVKANLLANATVEQFSESLTNKAGAGLRVVNKDVEEGVAVLAAYADQGVKGAEAGEKLNVVLRDVARAGSANAEEFRRLGIEVFDANGNLRNMADVVAEFETALGGMSDAQLAATLDQLGLTRAVGDGLKQLLGTSDAIRGYEEDLRTAGGTAEQVASKQLAAFNEQVGQDVTVVKEAAAALGENLAPAALAVTGTVADLADAFIRLPEPVQTTIGVTAGLAAAAGPAIYAGGKLIETYGKMAPTLGKATGGFKQLYEAWALGRTLAGKQTVSFGKMVGALGGVTLAVGAAVTIWQIHQQRQEESRSRVEELTATLDEQTGALTENTRATAVNHLEKNGALEAASRLGIGLELVTDAALGDADAQRELAAAMAEAEERAGAQSGAFGASKRETSDLTRNIRALRLGVGHFGDELERSQEQAAREQEALEGITRGAKATTERMTALAEAQGYTVTTSEDSATAAEDLAEALGEEEDATDDARTALEEYADAQLAATSPTFALINAQQTAKSALDSYNAAVKEHGVDSDEASAAAIDLAEAELRVGSAAAEAQGKFGQATDALDDMVRSGQLTAEQANRVRDAIGGARSEAERFRGNYVANVRADIDLAGISSADRALLSQMGLAGKIGFRHRGGVIERSDPGRLPGLDRDDRITNVEVGEEILTADDPRHRRNLRRGPSTRSADTVDMSRVESLLEALLAEQRDAHARTGDPWGGSLRQTVRAGG